MSIRTDSKCAVKSLPKRFMEWQVKSRYEGIQMIKKGKGMPSFEVHTPVMATYNRSDNLYGSNFDINLAAKGIGLIVKEEFLEDFLDRLDNLNSKKRNKKRRL